MPKTHHHLPPAGTVAWVLPWRGSILGSVLHGPAIWLFTAIHCGCVFLRVLNDRSALLAWIGEGSTIEASVSILVLLVSMYFAASYRRYLMFYTACMGINSAAVSYAGLVLIYLPRTTPLQRWNLCRHLLASAYLLYFELAQVGEAQWAVLHRLNLLHPSERKAIEEYLGPRVQLLQSWALEGAGYVLETGESSEASIAPFDKQVQAMRTHSAAIKDQLHRPAPHYVHTTFVVILSSIFILLAFTTAAVGTLLSIPAYFFSCLVVLVVTELSFVLSDPFHSNAASFDVDTFMARTMLNVRSLLSPQADYMTMHVDDTRELRD
mmetsp:Transcript_31670/g.72482  ORF Transcript_31670/g.72482 Transcript_31670/m.72482 type:complete len:322 (-) Transcript_31670:148-1113(-)